MSWKSSGAAGKGPFFGIDLQRPDRLIPVEGKPVSPSGGWPKIALDPFWERLAMPIQTAVTRSLLVAAMCAGWVSASVIPAGAQSLALEVKIPLGSVSGRIDHLAYDPAGGRLYVAELGNNTVDAIDIKSGKVVHRVSGLSEPQGVAYFPEQDLVIVANGGSGDVVGFRAADFKKAWLVALGSDADNVRVDPKSGEIFVGYASALAVFDPSGRLIRKVQLSGHPEGFQVGADRVVINVPSARQIAAVDRHDWVAAQWPVAGMRANFPMALDDGANRVLAVFRDPARLVEFDSRTGARVRDVPTCGDADDVWIDTKRQRVYVSCGDGHVAILRRDEANLRQVEQVRTVDGARTSLFVPGSDILFVAVRAHGLEPAAIWVFRATGN